MVNIDLLFNHSGSWIYEPHVLYKKELVHYWKGYDSDLLSYIDIVNEYQNLLGYDGIQQLLVGSPSGKLYEIEGDDGIRKLLSFVSEQYHVINLYAVEECELPVLVNNIVVNSEEFFPLETEVGTDCSEGESEPELDIPEYDHEQLDRISTQKKRNIAEGLHDYKDMYLGMSFFDIPDARKFIKLYALANKKQLKVIKSDRKRLTYKCGDDDCSFKVHISGDGGTPGVRIKALHSEHDCGTTYDNTSVDYITIAHYFKRRLQGTPKFKVREMRTDLKAAFELNSSEGKCKRAKKMVLESLEGSFVDGYKKIEAYANELRESNPGSDIVVNLSKDALAEGKRRFLRMYICFHALKMGFKEGLRPFIGLDGTFLKGKVKGQILVAVGQDCMNSFYPLAWAVVDKETKRTWEWFLGLLQISLELQNGEGITFMSDMQKGLQVAIGNVLPEAHHRFCVRHIEANWCKRWKTSELLKKLLWWSAWSSYEEDFHDQLKLLKQADESAASDLLNYPPKSWCRSYFDTVCKSQSVDNNFTESFNAWILDARYKPIIQMLEDIRIKVMNLLREKEESAMKWPTDISPKSKKLYDEYMKIGQACRVESNGDNGYEVSEGDDRHTVNLKTKKCTCRTWDLTGIPCPHAIKALLHKKINPLTQIHWVHTKEAFLLTYKHKLQPVRGEKFWKIQPEQEMEPPGLVNQAGRPRVKRVREKDEEIHRQAGWAVTRKGRVMTCSNCGEQDHNARTCEKPRNRNNGEGSKSRKRGLVDEEEGHPQTEEEINLSAPQWTEDSPGSQESSYVFMPTPGLQFQATPDEPDQGPEPMPKVISERKTRLQKRQKQQVPTGRRKIGFKGDHNGVSDPSNLPVAPTNLTWNGRAAISTNQLEVQAQKKMQKLKPRRGQYQFE